MSSEPPDFEAARDHVLREVVRFAATLREEGAAVPATAALSAVEALVEVGLGDRERVRAALHATLVHDARDREAFAESFGEFWYRLRTGLEATATVDDRDGGADGSERGARTDVEGASADAGATGAAEALEGTGDASPQGAAVRSRRVGDPEAGPVDGVAEDQRPGTFSPAGRPVPVADEPGGEEVDAGAVRRLERSLATLAGRRWARSRAGDAVDARRALRESLETGGVTLTLPGRERDRSSFRACVLVDVSRSVLDAVDRGLLLSFLDALVTDGRSVRVFFFDTALREVTDVFVDAAGEPAAALERAEVAWGGGTRIGDALAALRRDHPHAVERRTATLVISDGLDVGAETDLERGMAWLARRSGAVVWLNPLAASPRYEPTCSGMATARPYVDGLFAFGGPEDLTDIARQLERHGPHGPVGYRHDFRDRAGGARS